MFCENGVVSATKRTRQTRKGRPPLRPLHPRPTTREEIPTTTTAPCGGTSATILANAIESRTGSDDGRHHELITDFVSIHAEDLRRANDRLLVTKDDNETTTTSRSDCPVTKWGASLWEAIPDVVTSSSSSSFNGDRRGGGDARKRPSLLLGQRCERSSTTVLPAHRRRRRPCRWIAPRLASCCSRRPTPSETRSCIRRRRRRR